MNYILAIDQGTTNSRAILFNDSGNIVSQHTIPLKQFYPQPGWVEQDAEEMFLNSIACCNEAIQKANLTAKDIAAIGITNQRETTIVWDKKTGKPIYKAIVWLDRRTSDLCDSLKSIPLLEDYVRKHTGLLIDPYFSATKLMWLLDHIPHARARAEAGELLFGTIDCYLLWRLTNGQSHVTDITNAARTMLYNIISQEWDAHILEVLNIPKQLLPQVYDNTAHFGATEKHLLGDSINILGMAGDQQAATIGQACFKPQMIKVTYGTGCFMLLNTGSQLIHSKNQLLSTIAYRHRGQVTYGLEGSIFSAGITIKWLRDILKIINNAAESETLAKSIPDTGGVYLVPAFTGLGAPYWQPKARGLITGLSHNSGKAEVVRAGLESVVYQTCDLLTAMQEDTGLKITKVRVDGGMVVNNWLMQFLADLLEVEVQRPNCIETTALGAAYLAGLQAGVFESFEDISHRWQIDATFNPQMAKHQRQSLYEGWVKAVRLIAN